MLLLLLLIGICCANAREFFVNEPDNPVVYIETSHGTLGQERVGFLSAVIRPEHVRRSGERINFPTSGETEQWYQTIRAAGDERGHLVASQFSGPPLWYNLSPQSQRVNRNAGYRSVTTDWYGTECEVRRFLDCGGDRRVTWKVVMQYVDDSNRPHSYDLEVVFYVDGVEVDSIRSLIDNAMQSDTSRPFWTCSQCPTRRIYPADRFSNDDCKDGSGYEHSGELRRRRSDIASFDHFCEKEGIRNDDLSKEILDAVDDDYRNAMSPLGYLFWIMFRKSRS